MQRISYQFGPRWLRRWLERHQHPVSFALHVVGIPMTVVAIPVLFLAGIGWALVLFLGGYLLQFIGHTIEGNDMGEWVLVKRLLGWPYVAVSPRWQTPRTSQTP